MRTVLLAASQKRFLSERAPRYAFVRRAVSRFMPGEDTGSALAAARVLQSSGAGAVLTCLGENLKRAEEAEEVRKHYLDLLDSTRDPALDVEISVEPTQLGVYFTQFHGEKHLRARL